MYQIWKYIIFWFKATNEHGVHSPFVFKLITEGLYVKPDIEINSVFKKYRKSLLKNDTILNIEDFGAGSRTLKSNERSIASMAKYAGSTLKKMQLLFRLTSYFKPEQILELGTSLGLGTYALYKGNSSAQITTIEGSEALYKFTSEALRKETIDTIQFVNNTFENALTEVSKNNYDLIFFDGNHKKEATLTYVEQLLPTINNNTLWVFDDIYWSKDMTEAWEQIKTLSQVSVTIDLFYFGLVFFRKEQAKEHFKIRV